MNREADATSLGGTFIGRRSARGTSANLNHASGVPGIAYRYVSGLLDSTGDVGRYLRLAMGPDKKVYFSYYDATNKALRVSIVTIQNPVDQNCDGY